MACSGFRGNPDFAGPGSGCSGTGKRGVYRSGAGPEALEMTLPGERLNAISHQVLAVRLPQQMEASSPCFFRQMFEQIRKRPTHDFVSRPLNIGRRTVQVYALRRRIISAASPSRPKEAVAGSGTLAISLIS